MVFASLRKRELRARLAAGAVLASVKPAKLRGTIFAGKEKMLTSPENYVLVYQGSSVTLTLTVANEDGSHFDLTGARVLFTVKASAEAREPLIQKSSTVTASTAARTGLASILLVPADTRALAPGKYVFDVWVILPGDGGARLVVIPPSDFEVVRGITMLP